MTDLDVEPATPLDPGIDARRQLQDVASAVRIQASRILELEAEVERLRAAAVSARAAHFDRLAERCAALEEELDAIKATHTMRVLAAPRRLYSLVRRNGLSPRRWLAPQLAWWSRTRGRVRRAIRDPRAALAWLLRRVRR